MVLVKLEAECERLDLKEYSLYKMIERQSEIPRELQTIRRQPDFDLRRIFEAAMTLGNRESAEKHPMVIAARAKAEEKARPLEAEAKDLAEKIKSLEAIIREFKV